MSTTSDWKLVNRRPNIPEANRGDANWSGAWFADVDHWIALRSNYPRIVGWVGSVSHPAEGRSIDVGLPDGTSTWDAPECRLLGTTGRGHFLALGLILEDAVCLVDIDATPGAKPVARSYRVPISAHQSVVDICLSPDGKRLAWLMYPGGWDNAGAHLAAAYLMTSSIDGSNDVVAGSLSGLPGNSPLPHDAPLAFHWVDADKIAFEYRQRIWTARVDQ